MNKAVFLDRDGTVIVDKDYLSNPDDVELIEGYLVFKKFCNPFEGAISNKLKSVLAFL